MIISVKESFEGSGDTDHFLLDTSLIADHKLKNKFEKNKDGNVAIVGLDFEDYTDMREVAEVEPPQMVDALVNAWID
jgi:hypothetical protein